MPDTYAEQQNPGALHVLSADQFMPEDLEHLFAEAEAFRQLMADPSGRRELATRHLGESVCTLFYEPSTRTRVSFDRAASALGARVTSTENAREFSSAAKGETIEDTIRVLNEYAFSIIVLRHHETGGAVASKTPITIPRRAAALCINA